MGRVKISIITPCYTSKRLKDITELIDSVQDQTYDNLEMLVVTERLPELVKSITGYIQEKGYENVKVLYNEGDWGSYSARNLGIDQADGDILAFIDDDALLFRDWAEETAKHYVADDSVIGLTGPILPLWEHPSMSWFPREFYWIFSCTYWDWPETREVRNGYGTNISFRKEAFDACGMFKNKLQVGEKGESDWQRPGAKETEFSIRVTQKTGKRIMYNPRIKVRHKVYHYRLSNSFIVKRAYWEGFAKAWLNQHYHSGDQEILATEYELLWRISKNLVPKSLSLFLRHPIVTLRRFWITAMVISCVSGGYITQRLSYLFNRDRS